VKRNQNLKKNRKNSCLGGEKSQHKCVFGWDQDFTEAGREKEGDILGAGHGKEFGLNSNCN
jgi:hypothetical protein